MPQQSPSPSAPSGAPSVSSSWQNPETDGEVTLTDQSGRTSHLSRLEALRLAARIRTVLEGNRALDEKLEELYQNMH